MNVSALTADALKTLLSSPFSLFVLMMAASLANALKQLGVISQTGKPMTLASYMAYWPETITMILTNGIAFVVLVLTDQLNFASALGIGYGVNSVVDLLPGKRSIDLKKTPDDPAKVPPPAEETKKP